MSFISQGCHTKIAMPNSRLFYTNLTCDYLLYTEEVPMYITQFFTTWKISMTLQRVNILIENNFILVFQFFFMTFLHFSSNSRLFPDFGKVFWNSPLFPVFKFEWEAGFLSLKYFNTTINNHLYLLWENFRSPRCNSRPPMRQWRWYSLLEMRQCLNLLDENFRNEKRIRLTEANLDNLN